MTDNADMVTRNYQEAHNLRSILEQATRTTRQSVIELGAVINTLSATQEFSGEMRRDIADAITEAGEAYTWVVPLLEQLLASMDIIIRATGETSGLTAQTRDNLKVATGQFEKGETLAANHANLAANIASRESGLVYLFTEPERLRQIIRLAGPKVVLEMVAEMAKEEER